MYGSAAAEVTANRRAFWRQAIETRKPVTLQLYNYTLGIRIASASFDWPTAEATQSRYVADVAALRKAYADKACATE